MAGEFRGHLSHVRKISKRAGYAVEDKSCRREQHNESASARVEFQCSVARNGSIINGIDLVNPSRMPYTEKEEVSEMTSAFPSRDSIDFIWIRAIVTPENISSARTDNEILPSACSLNMLYL